MKTFIRKLLKARHPYEPLITVELSQSRLEHNILEFQKRAPGGTITPVLKSNAYGHGLMEIAKLLDVQKPRFPFFAVDSYFEAVYLRSNGISTPILIIGYTPAKTIIHSNLKNVSFATTSLDNLQELVSEKATLFPRKYTIHMKIDTGMRRQGILPEEIIPAAKLIKEKGNLVLEGVFSHFSDADNASDKFSQGQIVIWNNTVKKFRELFPNIKYFHMSNTDGHKFTKDIDANVSRLGIGLYGLLDTSFDPPIDLLPVMEMKTVISGTKKLRAGETVGYGNTFKAQKDMTIATIPVGYYEGIDRRLSNKGFVQVGNARTVCPIVGRVSMNITAVDVSEVRLPTIGTQVTVISNNPADPNSVTNLAKLCGVITYENAVRIPPHLKRVVVM